METTLVVDGAIFSDNFGREGAAIYVTRVKLTNTSVIKYSTFENNVSGN